MAPALFVAAHEDDETLAMGVPIAEHLAAAVPAQDVHVLLLTDGETSGARDDLNGTSSNSWWGVPHIPTAEGYTTLTQADLAAARVREATTALACLASGLPGTLTIHRAQLPSDTVTVAAAQAAILATCDLIAPGLPVRLKGHTWVTQWEAHPDHLAAGTAIKNLGAADPVRFGDRHHYLLPGYWGAANVAGITRFTDLPTDASISARVRNAAKAYGAWAPPQAYAIGMHSVKAWFDLLIATPKAMYHS